MKIGQMILLPDGHLVWRVSDAADRDGHKLYCLGFCHKDRQECGAAVLGYGLTLEEALANARIALATRYETLAAMDAAGLPVVDLTGRKV